MRKLFDRHVELIAHIPPKGTQHLVVELTRLIVCHQTRSFLQALRSHLISFLTAHLRHVGIIDGTLAEHHKQRYEDESEQRKRDPVGY